MKDQNKLFTRLTLIKLFVHVSKHIIFTSEKLNEASSLTLAHFHLPLI